jgi:uncharacterized repeat protein (TIGR02543 family)
MKKRVLAILLTLCMAVTLLPNVALAANAASVFVGGVELDGTDGKTYWKNGDTTSASGTETDYNAYFNSITGTLTLKDAAITGAASDLSNTDSSYGIFANGDLKITLVGTNTVTAGAATGYGTSCAINAHGTTIDGSGSLVATGGGAHNSYGVYGSTVRIEGGAITATGSTAAQNSAGVGVTDRVIISGSASVTATGGISNGGHSYGIHSFYGNITIQNSATVIATGGCGGDSSFGLRTDTGGVHIEGGVVTAVGGAALGNYGNSYGVYSNTAISAVGLLVARGDDYAMNGMAVSDATDPNTVINPLTGAYDSKFAVYGPEDTYTVISGSCIEPAPWNDTNAWSDSAKQQGYKLETIGGVQTFTIKNLIVSSGDNNAQAITLPDGAELVVEGVNVLCSGYVSESNSVGLYGRGALEISGDGSLIAIGGTTSGLFDSSRGISAGNTATPHSLTVSGDVKLTAIGGIVGSTYGDSEGISSQTAATFAGGTITAIGGTAGNYSYGIRSYGTLAFSGATATAVGGDAAAGTNYSIHANSGITLGSDVSLLAPPGGGLSSDGAFIATAPGGTTPATFAHIAQAVTAPPLPPADIDVSFSSAVADGSATTTTTKVTLNFNNDITDFAASDITITDTDTTGATKGTLTKKPGTGIYELALTGITQSGSINIAVAKTGFAFTPDDQDVTVYYYAPPSPPPSSGGGTDYYRLAFDTGGGSAVSSLTRAENTTIDLTLDQYTSTREGYIFTGWYSDAALTEKITSIRMTRNATIYAGWKPIASMENFVPDSAYSGFFDVDEGKWYGAENEGVIRDAVRLGIMEGYGDNLFGPEDELKISEAIKMACVVYSTYMGDGYDFIQGNPWYDVYVDYAIEMGLIGLDAFEDYEAICTRTQAAYIFASALPKSELPDISALIPPDVASGDLYAEEIHMLYRAGIFVGNDEIGTFGGDGAFNRAQAAAIITRLAMPEKRLAK